MNTIKFRRDTLGRWATANPVLSEGEPGYEKDTGRLKIGDGSTRWLDLPYYTPGSSPEIEALLEQHIRAAEPHPSYDDGPSLVLLYQNARV